MSDEPKTFSQEDVDRIVEERLNRAHKKAQEEKVSLVKQLDSLRETSKLSAELESQLEAMRKDTSTREETLARERSQLTGQITAWQSQYTDARIGHEIQAHAAASEVLPQGMKFAEALLRPIARLVPQVDADGKAIPGAFETKVKFPSKDKDGKPVTLDISISEAFKQMKETPDEYGALFKAHTQGGIGAGNHGTPDKPADIAKLIRENPQGYLEKYHPSKKA